jgi:hypothetical protein
MTQKKLITVKEMWKDFSDSIYKDVKPSKVQKVETERAFYAGAFSMLIAVREIGEETVSEDEGAAYLEQRMQELVKFYEDVAANFLKHQGKI